MGTSANTIQNQYVKLDGAGVSQENIVLTVG